MDKELENIVKEKIIPSVLVDFDWAVLYLGTDEIRIRLSDNKSNGTTGYNSFKYADEVIDLIQESIPTSIKILPEKGLKNVFVLVNTLNIDRKKCTDWGCSIERDVDDSSWYQPSKNYLRANFHFKCRSGAYTPSSFYMLVTFKDLSSYMENFGYKPGDMGAKIQDSIADINRQIEYWEAKKNIFKAMYDSLPDEERLAWELNN